VQFKKVIFKNAVKYLTKLHYLTSDLERLIFYDFKSQFLKTQFPNDLCSAIWFKITFIIYKIAIPNALLFATLCSASSLPTL
jgi:hypothetical protein